MERASSVSRYIGIFRITVSQLERLISEIETEQAERQLKLEKIELKTKNSTLKCDNLEELTNSGVWDNEVKKFDLLFFEDSNDSSKQRRTIHIGGGKDLDNSIYVSGDEEGWVVGTADLLCKRMKRYEVWYSILVKNDVPEILCGIVLCIGLMLTILFIFTTLGLTTSDESSESTHEWSYISKCSGADICVHLYPDFPRTNGMASRNIAQDLENC